MKVHPRSSGIPPYISHMNLHIPHNVHDLFVHIVLHTTDIPQHTNHNNPWPIYALPLKTLAHLSKTQYTEHSTRDNHFYCPYQPFVLCNIRNHEYILNKPLYPPYKQIPFFKTFRIPIKCSPLTFQQIAQTNNLWTQTSIGKAYEVVPNWSGCNWMNMNSEVLSKVF
jgi:hypothetical protein